MTTTRLHRPRPFPRGLSFGRRTYTWHLRKASRSAIAKDPLLISATIAGLVCLLLLACRPSPSHYPPPKNPSPSSRP